MEGSPSLSPLSSPSEMTQTWLEQVLEKKLGSSVKIKTWSMKKPETKSGYLSEICFIKISFFVCGEGNEKKEEERSLVAKFFPESDQIMKTMEKNCLGEREVEFYKHTLTEEFRLFCKNSGLCHPAPDVYLAELRDRKLSLVLHDLNSEGFKLSVPIEGNSLQQIKSTLASVAVIHASGIATIRNHGKHPVDISFSSSNLGSFLVDGINIQMKILEGTHIKDNVKSLLPLSQEFLTVEEKHPFVDTLIHGDLWTANVMFSEGDQEACIFDWQFARIGNLVCDIVSLLLMSGAPHTYTEHLAEVLECYWESLEQSLKKNGIPVDITFPDLVRNVESMWIYGYMFFTLSLSAMIGNQIDEDRVKAVVHFMEKKEVFKKFLS
ncbi:uncharacterized protein LOC126985000 isoform X2 [Eriocheir sinensis]|uniref:uncharacterized protein LOC126985000 isoform X2 n=1 Tax=Eriocheir sinensis TaxID=95602 RepID=UPI0021C9FDB7|nr:uncharacterized protein LOC126985000 isoform X2 [Eriocheir sinensis]